MFQLYTDTGISVIYVTAHRCAGGLKKLDLRSGSQRHRHFVGFFNVPVQARTRDQPFYTVIPRNRPHLVAFTTRWGYGGHILDLTPRVPMVQRGKTLSFHTDPDSRTHYCYTWRYLNDSFLFLLQKSSKQKLCTKPTITCQLSSRFYMQMICNSCQMDQRWH